MIYNFTAYNPTRLHFGEGCVEKLGEKSLKYGNKALLVYGQGSVKKYGYYDTVKKQLNLSGIDVVEYSGIKPNPVIEDVEAAAELGRLNKVDMVVALGGGSVIDSAKIIALGIANNEYTWDYLTHNKKPQKTVPLICILTLAATGTEMNAAAVVQNHSTGEKLGYVNELNFPKEAFLDPRFTLTVPKDYTAYGIVDLVAHALEAYFGKGEPELIDQITFSIIKDAMLWGPKLLDNLQNLEYRANIMLDATLALNGLTSYGKKGGDWGVHGIGHEISLLFDTAHGATLSIGYIAWLKLHMNRIPERIIKLGENLFDVKTVDETIFKLEEFFSSINSPVRLSQIELDDINRQNLLIQMNKNNVSGMNHTLSGKDRRQLVELMA
jgi:alcohol dehydrogenase YqhD (iron-dependent ADH family)